MRNRFSSGPLAQPLRRGLFVLLAGVLTLPLLPRAQAADAQAQLQAFARNVTAATGSFRQSTQAARGTPQPEQRGMFAFQRPGKFRWNITAPFEQLIVSDGKQLYQYDPDLAQVSVRGVDAALGNAPAQVLFGDGAMEKSFQLEALPAKDGLSWVRATPLSADAGFAFMDIGMADNLPVRIDILDAFNQVTQVEFTAIVPNPSLPATEFRFDAPAGVDVVRME